MKKILPIAFAEIYAKAFPLRPADSLRVFFRHAVRASSIRLPLRSEKWRSLEWYGQIGSDLGRDIWGVRENGESVCIQCVNLKNLKLSKAEKDIAKVLKADNGIPHTFRIVAISNLSAPLRDKIKNHVVTLGVKVSENWSGPECEEFLDDGAESLLRTC